jgi:uncharacterized protein with PIN domain
LSGKPKFIVDQNAGKLTKLLRSMGFDAVFFDGLDDADMLAIALAENRVVLTRDTHIMKRGVVSSGRIRAILIEADKAEFQMRQVIDSLNLRHQAAPFTRCMECNQILKEREKEEIKDRVPPYVYKTQDKYMECPDCHRIYWRGTHWQAMIKRLEKLVHHEG